MYISLGWGGFKAPQHVYQPRDGSSHPSLLSPSCLCESSSSNSVLTSTHVCAQTLLRSPLMSVLGHYSDSRSRPCSNITQTPAHVCAQTLLGLRLMSMLERYSDSHSCPCLDATQSPAHIRTWTLLGTPL
jgi:hypothetical protein